MSRHDLIAGLNRKGIHGNVRARILRLNPDYREGNRVRGWHPAPTTYSKFELLDCITITRFNRVYGKGAHRQIPKNFLVSNGGKRRLIPLQYVFENQPQEN